MEKVKCFCKYIKYELEGAEKYGKEAILMKEIDKNLADTFNQIAKEELVHADKIHSNCVKYMNAKKANEELSPAAEEIWEYEKDNIIDWTAKIKAMVDMYK